MRGDTYNGGFLDIGMTHAPRLTFTGGGGPAVVLTFVDSLVGGKGAATPIQTEINLPLERFLGRRAFHRGCCCH